ncbi:hypothetical protein [Nonomuraea sp. NPDC050786]|uniref:hypothetical protein n=1 Tax=Nonomuraea sp. NPDC050786 TaxID=3154840 RepID=UPI00340CB654
MISGPPPMGAISQQKPYRRELSDLLVGQEVDQAVADRLHMSGRRLLEESLAVFGDDDHGPAFVVGVVFARGRPAFSSWATW